MSWLAPLFKHRTLALALALAALIVSCQLSEVYLDSFRVDLESCYRGFGNVVGPSSSSSVPLDLEVLYPQANGAIWICIDGVAVYWELRSVWLASAEIVQQDEFPQCSLLEHRTLAPALAVLVVPRQLSGVHLDSFRVNSEFCCSVFNGVAALLAGYRALSFPELYYFSLDSGPFDA